MHTYKDSGVDKEEGYKAVDKIKSKVTETHNENVLTGLGSFASLYALKDYKNPVLVSGTDGVGTKLAIAFTKKIFNTVGQDCFAMCANDILCQGAKPLFFLDYLACGKLDSDVSSEIVMGMAEACKDADCALVGGETAEMPGFYKDGDYDMAGFCVGAVERDRIINGKDVEEGDIILGLASSGVHSNGFSLIRSLVTDLDEDFQGEPVYKELLKPTRVYVRNVLKLLESHFEHISGMAHITGGGLPENLPRTIPEGLCGKIMKDSVPVLPIFDWLRGKGVPDEEMWGTFNMGVGFILIVRAEQKELIVSTLETLGESVAILGQIIKSDKKICLI
ncbi:phosphoribosylformylglycinamidine cyclo-ligase [Oceanispirochaeta sp.]|jgi:phosphoribosylformylglycinamidine cyclo-ligase|uniref:phosphoribosylformylglycinamidine cyclo-ligase n=1 Tax=Oceanispirochaeta sp. TaxID=2035350 RepID=UPI00261FA40F|nr:phosphoribosylformylglycinamidine cyclo-ligase [Oceanispirochaeta sp.]MDA3958117.1 phosphoribosylformylglycinamidine cyclo-ligase [Oceanispirochaeta sp.]